MHRATLCAVLIIGSSTACYDSPELPGEPGAPGSGPTFYEDVAPILKDRCLSCHQEGGIAPANWNFESYERAKAQAGAIANATEARRMPPFLVDDSGDCNHWKDSLWLSDEEIKTLGDWAAAGAPEGDPSNDPGLPDPRSQLENPSLTLTLSEPYTPTGSPSSPDDYRCFILDPGLTEDAFLTAYELVPGDPRVVHHMILYTLDSEQAEAAADDLDREDSTDGYPCYGGAGVPDFRMVAGWAPGGGVTSMPEGTGLRLEAGRRVVMQLHYSVALGTYPDQTSLRLQLESNVDKEGVMFIWGKNNFELAPGQEAVTITGSDVLANIGRLQPLAAQGFTELDLHWVFPHMHKLGQTMRFDVEVGGSDRCLADVPDWDFNWQMGYFLTEPIRMGAADKLKISCTYETTMREEVTHHGDGTEDEMCLGAFYATGAD